MSPRLAGRGVARDLGIEIVIIIAQPIERRVRKWHHRDVAADEKRGKGHLRGAVILDGSSTVSRISRAASERFRTVVYDYPGENRGDEARLGRITHENLVDDLFGLIDHQVDVLAGAGQVVDEGLHGGIEANEVEAAVALGRAEPSGLRRSEQSARRNR